MRPQPAHGRSNQQKQLILGAWSHFREYISGYSPDINAFEGRKRKTTNPCIKSTANGIT